MKKLVKLQQVPPECVQDYCYGVPVSVQGGKKYACDNVIKVESGGRYKLFTEGSDIVHILSGSGFFKWARGETSFAAGECFLLEQVGEYELNGKCNFLVVRK